MDMTITPQVSGSSIGSESIVPTSSGVNINPGIFDKFLMSLGHNILQFANPAVVSRGSYATSEIPDNAPAADNTGWWIGLSVVVLIVMILLGRR